MERKEEKTKLGILDVAKKKRHFHLLQKLHQGKHLSRSEIKELEKYEGKSIPAGCVDTQERLAAILGVSVRTVQNWVKDGLPKTKEGYFDIKDIQEWRFHRDKRSKGRESKKKIDWESKYREYKAKLAEMDLKEKKGLLVPVSQVEKDNVQKILAVKRKFLSLPRIVAPQLVGLNVRKIEQILRMRVEEVINDFAQGATEEKSTRKQSRKKK